MNTPMPAKLFDRSTPARLWALAFGGVLLLWSMLAAQIQLQEHDALKNGPAIAERVADAYARQVTDLIDQSDQLLLTLSHLRRHGTSVTEMERLLESLPSHSWQNPYYIDEHGWVRSARAPQSRGMSVLAEDFFQHHRSDASDTLTLHPPSPGIGAMTGTTVVRLTRRVDLANGGFGGVIVLPVPASTLTLLPDASLAAFKPLTVAAIAGGPIIVGKDAANGIRHAGQSEIHEAGWASDRLSIEQASRYLTDRGGYFTARKRLDTHPLDLLVAIRKHDLLAPLEKERSDLIMLGALAGLVVLVITGVASWRLSRRRASEEQSLHAWTVFRHAVDESRDEFLMLTPLRNDAGQPEDFRIDDCNAEAARALGLTHEAIVDRSLSDVLPVSDWTETKDFLLRALGSGFAELEASFPHAAQPKGRWMYCRATLVDGCLAVTLRDVTELKEKEVQLNKLALTDGLTGLPNRHWVNQRLPVLLKGAAVAQQHVAALFIDLDNFKRINDTLGHKAGDDYLQMAAVSIRQVVREDDIVVRLGGDEFLVIAQGLDDLQHAHSVAEGIIGRIRELGQQARWSAAYPRASIGIAAFPVDAREASELMQAADIAMYEAKRLGKDRYQVYLPTMRDRLREDHSLEAGLRRALAEGALSLRLLPRASASSGQLTGFEALLRWDHPVLGPIPPVRFIPIAERYSLIDDIGGWVVEEVCRILVDWSRQTRNLPPISINVSARQLRSPRLREHLRRCAQQYGIRPSCIELELTEAILVSDDPAIRAELAELRQLGHKLIIDDFGTGYSSLVHLQDLQIATLKIDASFVQNLAAGVEGALICRTMVQIGQTLGVEVIAEGVEKAEQLQKLQQFGCHGVQGYLVAAPMREEEAFALLNQRELFAPAEGAKAAPVVPPGWPELPGNASG